MKTTNYQVIDDRGCLLLPTKLLNQLDITKNDFLTASYNPENNALTLDANGKGDVPITLDDYSRAYLPKQLREKLGWLNINKGDTIAVSVCPWARTITLKLHSKYELMCVFCKNPNTVVDINGIAVCQYCAEKIAGAMAS